MSQASYIEPCAEEPCARCRFRRYDSFHDELWCGHEPPPEGLPERLLVDKWGHCNFWSEET